MDTARATTYAERLWPSPGVWVAALGIGATLGFVVLPFGGAAGIAGAAAGVVLAVALLIAWTPRICVRDGQFTAGRAHIPVTLLGPAEPLDAAAMRTARGTGLDARAYLCVRGWVTAGVRVPVLDPADPVPYWLVSARHPEALAAALAAAAGPGAA